MVKLLIEQFLMKSIWKKIKDKLSYLFFVTKFFPISQRLPQESNNLLSFFTQMISQLFGHPEQLVLVVLK